MWNYPRIPERWWGQRLSAVCGRPVEGPCFVWLLSFRTLFLFTIWFLFFQCYLTRGCLTICWFLLGLCLFAFSHSCILRTNKAGFDRCVPFSSDVLSFFSAMLQSSAYLVQSTITYFCKVMNRTAVWMLAVGALLTGFMIAVLKSPPQAGGWWCYSGMVCKLKW